MKSLIKIKNKKINTLCEENKSWKNLQTLITSMTC